MRRKSIVLFVTAYLILNISTIVFASEHHYITGNSVRIDPKEEILEIRNSGRQVSDSLMRRLSEAAERGEAVHVTTFASTSAPIPASPPMVYESGIVSPSKEWIQITFREAINLHLRQN